MPENGDRHVEISLGLNPEGIQQGLDEAERKLQEGLQRLEQIAGQTSGAGGSLLPGLSSFSTGVETTQQSFEVPSALSSFLPAVGGGFSASVPPPAGSTLSAPAAEAIAFGQGAGGGGGGDELRQLIDAIKDLHGGVREEGRGRQQDTQQNRGLLEWMRASAILQTGQQVIGQASHGNFFGAAGTAIGGGLGLLATPFVGPAGIAMGATAGGMLGGLVEGIVGGTTGARAFTQSTADMGRRFSDPGAPDVLRDYRLGERFGYTAEQSAGMIDRLREGRVVGSAVEGGPLVSAIQELTRSLGLNAEAVTDLYVAYSKTGGDKGPAGFKDYITTVVGGAVSAGFEANIQQYAELMNSARSQSVQQTGNAVSDKAFGMLQDAMTYITGGGSAAAALFRDNPQMAGGALQTFLGMGGSTPYSLGAGYMRMAGISEAAIDPRFQTQETQIANAQQMVGWHTDRIASISGMSEDEFNRRAAADPDFVRGQFQDNVLLQRMSTQMLGAQLGRDPTAQDLRAYEELINLSASNGGQLPAGSGPDAARVQEIMQQFGMDPADRQREMEATRHNRQMEVMSHFEDLMTKVDEWMINIYDYILKFDLEAVQEAILDGMDKLGAFVKWVIPKVEAFAKDAKAAFDRLIKWADENNIAERIGRVMGAAGRVGGALRENGVYDAPSAARAGGRFGVRSGIDLFRRLFGGEEADDQFNDTPEGGVTATPGYNVFKFAPGDVVSARQSGQPGNGTSLSDILLFLNNWQGITGQYHAQNLEIYALAQETAEKDLELTTNIEKNIEVTTAKIWPVVLERLGDLIGLGEVSNELLTKLNEQVPLVIAAIASVQQAITQIMGSLAGGAAGGGGDAGGAFASGLFTGPSANIGGSSSYHIDSKFSRSLSWEKIVEYFDAMALAYAEQNRRIEFSNEGVAGQVYDPSASLEDKIRLLQQANAAHDHSVSPNYYSFDYYIPANGEDRGGPSSRNAEILLPNVPGGSVDYGTAGNYGNFATVRDADGNIIYKTGHGDNRVALPQDRTLPSAPPPAAGSGAGPGGLPQLGPGYNSLQQLAGVLSQDSDFDTSTPEGRAALALALSIGGTEVYSRGSTATDFFSRRGGTNNNMLGFAQFNLEYHRARTDTQGEYVDFIGDTLTGQSVLPNGRSGGNIAARLAAAVQSGQISSGAELERWTRQNNLGGSNWQGIDDGWGRVPGLSDQLLQYLRSPQVGGSLQSSLPQRGGATQISNNYSVAVNVGGGADADVVAQGVRIGLDQATDDFERTWRQDRNPRNNDGYLANPALA